MDKKELFELDFLVQSFLKKSDQQTLDLNDLVKITVKELNQLVRKVSRTSFSAGRETFW